MDRFSRAAPVHNPNRRYSGNKMPVELGKELFSKDQSHLQRGLSALYNATKRSSDFVQEPMSMDPDIKALQRRLKIQKDRLLAWGLDWSDPSESVGNHAEIDKALSRAGLSDLVQSIMSTIQDTLSELKPLWQISQRPLGSVGGKDSEKVAGEWKPPLVVWDKSKFADLINDLTTSIDTLSDVSRTRTSARSTVARVNSLQTTPSDADLGYLESTRIRAPQQIHPRSLHPLSVPYAPQLQVPESKTHLIVSMRREAFESLKNYVDGPVGPHFLLEHAPFDPVYSQTGITPPLARFEKLNDALQDPVPWSGARVGLPELLAYYEDTEKSRLGLIYQIPYPFGARGVMPPSARLSNLSQLLCRHDFEPRLEVKFRLAENLSALIFKLHSRGINHGNLLDTAVSFYSHGPDEIQSVDLRKPLVSSFELFARDASEQQGDVSFRLHHHPLDPRITPHSPLAGNNDPRTLDLYSLAMLLVSIGLWTRLEDLVSGPSVSSIPESILEPLAVRCGTLYMKVVQMFWNAVDQEISTPESGNDILRTIKPRAIEYLKICSKLDDTSDFDEDFSKPRGPPSLALDEPDIGKRSALSDISSGRLTREKVWKRSARIELPDAGEPSASTDERKKTNLQPLISGPVAEPKSMPMRQETESQTRKSRLYPQLPLPPDAIKSWNDMIMPQLNMALRHFYRKHPESVEISLESMGESLEKAKPTVLVVCMSVGKVRAILVKKLGTLFDGSTGIALKVTRGAIVQSTAIPRGMRSVSGADDGEGDPAARNPGYQKCPQSGASIGAWARARDRHLPAASLGGWIVVDGKPYGMTVHHMLDDLDADCLHSHESNDRDGTTRSSYGNYNSSYRPTELFTENSNASEDWACELSDIDSEYSDTEIMSDEEDDTEDDEDNGISEQPGDIPGIKPDYGEEFVVTQPALEDVDEDFYPCADTMNADHLDSCRLGEVYASSGIRRRQDSGGLIHEVDWALFDFEAGRLPEENIMPRAHGQDEHVTLSKSAKSAKLSPTVLKPSGIATLPELPGLDIQCLGRTSGLQIGRISPVITSIKIYGRQTPSHTYQVSGKAAMVSKAGPSATENTQEWQLPQNSPTASHLLGIPGDSGAWIIDRHDGRLCGHVLAWSPRKKTAYMCPMEVLVHDISEVLGTKDIRLFTVSPSPPLLPQSGSTSGTEQGRGQEEDLLDVVEIQALTAGVGDLRVQAKSQTAS